MEVGKVGLYIVSVHGVQIRLFLDANNSRYGMSIFQLTLPDRNYISTFQIKLRAYFFKFLPRRLLYQIIYFPVCFPDQRRCRNSKNNILNIGLAGWTIVEHIELQLH